MKNFKEFKRDFKEIINLEEDEDVYAAYECYLLGFVDGKEEVFKVMLSSAPITMPNVPMPNVPMPNVPMPNVPMPNVPYAQFTCETEEK